jgi:hypothetical protein
MRQTALGYVEHAQFGAKLKTMKFLLMAALALTTAACSTDDDEVVPATPSVQTQPEGIKITATLAPKEDMAGTRYLSNDGDKIISTWTVGTQIAILYRVGSEWKCSDAEITYVNASGAATIEFTVDEATVDGTDCEIVYPRAAARDDHQDVKAFSMTDWLTNQKGSFVSDGNFIDVRVGSGTIHTTTPGLTVTAQPAAQNAIFKFTFSGVKIGPNSPLMIKDNYNMTVITVKPSAETSEVYVAMPPAVSKTYKFIVDTDDNRYIKSGTAAIEAGKYYQTPIDMIARYPIAAADATPDDLGCLLAKDGKIYLNTFAASAAGTIDVAMIAYVGSDTGEEDELFCLYNHGLAIGLNDLTDMYGLMWSTAMDNAIHSSHSTPPNFAKESGCQYRDATHYSDAYPAFKAVIDADVSDLPAFCTNWFLPTGYQWQKMRFAFGSADALRSAFSKAGLAGLAAGKYWSSTEASATGAWCFDFSNGSWTKENKTSQHYVRACIAF